MIEQYYYKGSEKDEDGFYLKGNTSVPSYHKNEELQEPSESWDNEGRYLQWTEVNNEKRPHCNQRLAHSSTAVKNTLLRAGFVESEMARLTLHEVRSKTAVALVSYVCGQPTSPTFTGVKSLQLAGAGRARRSSQTAMVMSVA